MNRYKAGLFFVLISMLVSGCSENHPPVITGVNCSPDTRYAGTLFTLTATATDEDGDSLNFFWTADEGSFPYSATTNTVTWQSPVTGAGKTCTLSLMVSDGHSEVPRDIQIALGEPQLGSLEGSVCFTNFTIPVPGAIVTAGGYIDTADERGYFSFLNIPALEYTLTVTKESYSTCTRKVVVPANGLLHVTPEITSVNFTTKLSGTITDSDELPVANARVVVLNPDGSESMLMTTTNSSGYYRLWYIPHGKRSLLITKDETAETRFVGFRETVDFQDIEFQLNMTMQTVILKGSFTDSRDNHSYRFKTIGEMTWMAENLAYIPAVSPPTDVSVIDAKYYVYDYQGTEVGAASATENYRVYGVLYNWTAALSACPPGWRLPGISEWYTLEQFLGENAGKALKSASGWYDHGNGDNASGLAVFPGGRMDYKDTFSGVSKSSFFWTTTITDESPHYQYLMNTSNELYSVRGTGKQGFSVRCIRN